MLVSNQAFTFVLTLAVSTYTNMLRETSREHFNVNVVQGTIVYKISLICQMLRYIFTMPMS